MTVPLLIIVCGSGIAGTELRSRDWGGPAGSTRNTHVPGPSAVSLSSDLKQYS